MATFLKVDMRAAAVIAAVGAVLTAALVAPDQVVGFLEAIQAAIMGGY